MWLCVSCAYRVRRGVLRLGQVEQVGREALLVDAVHLWYGMGESVERSKKGLSGAGRGMRKPEESGMERGSDQRVVGA